MSIKQRSAQDAKRLLNYSVSCFVSQSLHSKVVAKEGGEMVSYEIERREWIMSLLHRKVVIVNAIENASEDQIYLSLFI